jgi:hypothetical protein
VYRFRAMRPPFAGRNPNSRSDLVYRGQVNPGTTQHAQDTDKVNSMLLSIIRQLIVDEWTFMQANRIE